MPKVKFHENYRFDVSSARGFSATENVKELDRNGISNDYI